MIEMFFYDKRVLYTIIGVFVAVTLVGYLSNLESLYGLLVAVPGVLMAISFHEFAHAYTAYKLGDDTAKQQGRITLNPLKHVDPLGIILLLFVGIGWGRPVQVDSRNIKRNISYRKAEALISAAGPIANFILAIVISIIYALILKFNVLANFGFRASFTIMEIIIYAIIINIGLGVFNLIPLPPLDGSKVLSSFLPAKADMWFRENENIFYIIFLVLWITGIAGVIISPIRNALYYGIMNLVSAIFGL